MRKVPAALFLGGMFAALSATAFGGATPEARQSGTAEPKWQVFRGLKADADSPVLGSGWAANRIWVTARYAETLLGKASLAGFPALLAASYHSGRLVVAVWSDSPRTKGRQAVLLLRGDARGRNARTASVIELTFTWPLRAVYNYVCIEPVVYAAFVPRGLGAVMLYRAGGTPNPYGCPLVPVAFLPLRG